MALFEVADFYEKILKLYKYHKLMSHTYRHV
jgi:hypothetical protein